MINMTPADFVRESNRIEGILRDPTEAEVAAFLHFLDVDCPRVDDIERFVAVNQPGAVLRRARGLDVRVGSYVAPPGGPGIEKVLWPLLQDVAYGLHPHEAHLRYERLHPFTDGNGRSGRALWAWGMKKYHGGFPLGFLHHFYYQTLEFAQ
jgi:hypothetical protein